MCLKIFYFILLSTEEHFLLDMHVPANRHDLVAVMLVNTLVAVDWRKDFYNENLSVLTGTSLTLSVLYTFTLKASRKGSKLHLMWINMIHA